MYEGLVIVQNVCIYMCSVLKLIMYEKKTLDRHNEMTIHKNYKIEGEL